MSDIVFLYITAPTRDEAKSLGKSLLESKLAACINIIPNMESIYWWEGKIESAEEVVLIAKTTENHEKDAIAFIKDNHSYDCPCVVSIPIANGNSDYFKWININLMTEK